MVGITNLVTYGVSINLLCQMYIFPATCMHDSCCMAGCLYGLLQGLVVHPVQASDAQKDVYHGSNSISQAAEVSKEEELVYP